jgi:hypothetical protein
MSAFQWQYFMLGVMLEAYPVYSRSAHIQQSLKTTTNVAFALWNQYLLHYLFFGVVLDAGQ